MSFVVRRLARLVIVLLCVTFFSFFLLQLLPGDPVTTIAPIAPPEVRRAITVENKLDQPIYDQYWNWLTKFGRGDLGNYYRSSGKDPVWGDVKDAWPVSLQLIVYSMTLTLLIAVPLGVFSAYVAGSRLDRLLNATIFGAISVPDFALGLVLAYVVGVKLRWLPNNGYKRPSAGIVKHVRTMILPVVSLSVGQIAGYMRVLRSDMIATLQEDFITMARSKGIPARRVLWRHALRPSSLTLLTIAGLNVGALIGGTVLLEIVFALPGMGSLITESIRARQYVALQSMVALVAIVYVAMNVLIDLLYARLDPRVRLGRA